MLYGCSENRMLQDMYGDAAGRTERGCKVKVCMVVEGCYPYIAGGVSSWVHGMIQSFPKVEFVI